MTWDEKEALCKEKIHKAKKELLSTLVPLLDTVLGMMRDVEAEAIKRKIYRQQFRKNYRQAMSLLCDALPSGDDSLSNEVFTAMLDAANDSLGHNITQLRFTVKNILDENKQQDSDFISQMETIGILISVAATIYRSVYNDTFLYCQRTAAKDIDMNGVKYKHLDNQLHLSLYSHVRRYDAMRMLKEWGKVMDVLPGYSEAMHTAVDAHLHVCRHRDNMVRLVTSAKRIEADFSKAVDENPEIIDKYESITKEQSDGI